MEIEQTALPSLKPRDDAGEKSAGGSQNGSEAKSTWLP